MLTRTVSSAAAQNSCGLVKRAELSDLTSLAVGPPPVGIDAVAIGATNPGEIETMDVPPVVASQMPPRIHPAIEPQDFGGGST